MPTRISPFLWFDSQAEEAANYYCSIFPNSRITALSRYTDAGREQHRQKPGTAMAVSFELDGNAFNALNGGPLYTFTEAVSFMVTCKDQQEIDHYWEKLGADGDPTAQRCGWLKDRYGLSWQIVPEKMGDFFNGPGGGAAMQAMLKMKKLDIAELRRAKESGG